MFAFIEQVRNNINEITNDNKLRTQQLVRDVRLHHHRKDRAMENAHRSAFATHWVNDIEELLRRSSRYNFPCKHTQVPGKHIQVWVGLDIAPY